MAVKIRMKRLGARKNPFYRIVVADARSPRNGRFIEELGYYNPVSAPKQFSVDADRARQWIRNGAQPTDSVSRLFRTYSVLTAEGIVESGLPKAHESVEIPVAPTEVTGKAEDAESAEA